MITETVFVNSKAVVVHASLYYVKGLNTMETNREEKEELKRIHQKPKRNVKRKKKFLTTDAGRLRLKHMIRY